MVELVNEIPLITVPSQSFQVILGGQECTILIYMRVPLPDRASRLFPAYPDGSLYLNLDVGDVRVVTGAVCQDRQHIIQHAQYHFRGRLAFVDTEGVDNPRWKGLGTRWVLVYEQAQEASA